MLFLSFCQTGATDVERWDVSHNELDLPSITQPVMYEKISSRRSVPQLYEEKLKVRVFGTFLVFTCFLTTTL